MVQNSTAPYISPGLANVCTPLYVPDATNVFMNECVHHFPCLVFTFHD